MVLDDAVLGLLMRNWKRKRNGKRMKRRREMKGDELKSGGRDGETGGGLRWRC